MSKFWLSCLCILSLSACGTLKTLPSSQGTLAEFDSSEPPIYTDDSIDDGRCYGCERKFIEHRHYHPNIIPSAQNTRAYPDVLESSNMSAAQHTTAYPDVLESSNMWAAQHTRPYPDVVESSNMWAAQHTSVSPSSPEDMASSPPMSTQSRHSHVRSEVSSRSTWSDPSVEESAVDISNDKNIY